MRLVSLLPSATEIVYALGIADSLVGVTFECDEPPAARLEKVVVVAGRDTTGMTPGEIDSYVRERMAAGDDLYTLRAGALAGLRPDLILTQDLCRVCAIPSGDVATALDHLGCTAQVLSLDPHSLDDVLASILQVGAMTGSDDAARDLVGTLLSRLTDLADAVGTRPRPRVAVVEWVDPPFTAGHWVPDLVRAAGGIPVSAGAGRRSEQTSWQAIRDERPDVAVIAPCGFHLDGAAEHAAVAASHLPGVPVWAIDADALVVRPGPRLVGGAEAIGSILHPAAVRRDPAAVRRVA